MDRVFKLRYSARLASAHYVLSILGAIFVLAPSMGLTLFWDALAGFQPTTLFKILSGMTTFGYLMTLVGLVVFMVLVTQALLLRLRPTRAAR